ncbi:MBL fold metallo-hydrolase [Vibrio pectenicida]|uniref:MBL fold metallo-hydrolase n=1 Tax=Vibrio pectenicida TaxID=62763 RepID=A0A7Y4A274_9VIBR|nr:MBL fold metallo-hydrolase [Vibrio pectenicida]NOH73390.1 MBL fold metallo-hydrolase [Vibrio pectenicida]
MILTALIENTRLDGRTDLKVERGLALYAETLGQRILFDAGDSRRFCDNAEQLGIKLQNVTSAVISHRHHDHFNGIAHFFSHNSIAPVYVKKCSKTEYLFRAFGFKSNVGFNSNIFTQWPDRFRFVDTLTEIYPGIYVITDICNKYSQPFGNKYLFTRTEKGYENDDFTHELLLVVKEHDGLIIFTGCAHSGLLNMLETAVQLYPSTKIKAVVGGFHMVGLPLFNNIGGSEEDIRLIGKTLCMYSVGKFYTGHCTGSKAFGILKSVLGDKIEYLPTGRCVTI